MSWNHRLLLKDGVVDIVECYYNPEGALVGYCNACAVGCPDLEVPDQVMVIQEQLQQMLESCQKPVLRPKDFIYP